MYYNKNKVYLSTFELFADKYNCPDCMSEIKFDINGDFKCTCGFSINVVKITNTPHNLKTIIKKVKTENNFKNSIGKIKCVINSLSNIGEYEKAEQLNEMLCKFLKNDALISSNKLLAVMLLKEAAAKAAASEKIEVNTLGFKLSCLINKAEGLDWDY